MSGSVLWFMTGTFGLWKNFRYNQFLLSKVHSISSCKSRIRFLQMQLIIAEASYIYRRVHANSKLFTFGKVADNSLQASFLTWVVGFCGIVSAIREIGLLICTAFVKYSWKSNLSNFLSFLFQNLRTS